MSIETEIASLTTAIRNLTDVLLASAAKALPAPTATFTAPAPEPTPAPAPEPKKTVKKEAAPVPTPCTHVLSVVGGVPVGVAQWWISRPTPP